MTLFVTFGACCGVLLGCGTGSSVASGRAASGDAVRVSVVASTTQSTFDGPPSAPESDGAPIVYVPSSAEGPYPPPLPVITATRTPPSGAAQAVVAESAQSNACCTGAELAPPQSGLLTAATVGDCDRRDNYLDYVSRHEGERMRLGLDLRSRLRVKVVDERGRPVIGAEVLVADTIYGSTHADGVWDLFPAVVGLQPGRVPLVIRPARGMSARLEVDIPSAGDGSDVTFTSQGADASGATALDLGFLIDVTGSMEDELRYVDAEIGSIVHQIKGRAPQVLVRVGAVLYRDRSEPDLVAQIPFTNDVGAFAYTLRQIHAYGGGDYPEDMNAGLRTAMREMAWSDSVSAVRVLTLIADAPPQTYADESYRVREALIDAAARGIRILPVAASGADRDTEYLMRAMAAFTSTPYVYLTDDSGVGGPHVDADTDRVGVERFNQLLVRLALADLAGAGMHEPGAFGPRMGQEE